jgi:hypothetical protein
MIRCVIRKKKVAATPEEKVRQGCLFWMIKDLGYPPSQIVVETALSELPHLQPLSKSVPDRRIDVCVFHQGAPLLLIECKAGAVEEKALRQVSGYLHWVKAPYFALVGDRCVKTYHFKDQEVVCLEGLPTWDSITKGVVIL